MRPQAWQINGTLKEDDKGVDPATWGNTAAKGALFNPTRGSGAASGLVTMDDEYASFMAELGGGGPPGAPKISSAELAAQVQTKPPPVPPCPTAAFTAVILRPRCGGPPVVTGAVEQI